MNFDMLELFTKDEFKKLFEEFYHIKDEVRIQKEKDDELEELMLSMHKHRREEKEANESKNNSSAIIHSILDEFCNIDSKVFIHDTAELFDSKKLFSDADELFK